MCPHARRYRPEPTKVALWPFVRSFSAGEGWIVATLGDMLTRLSLLLFVLLCGASCSKSQKEEQPSSTIAQPVAKRACVRSSKHPSEKIALKLIQDIQANKFSEAPYTFRSDREFSKETREELFRSLERYIKNDQWCLWHTRVDLYDGIDDSADVILRARTGGYLVLLVGYEYVDKRWRVSAYEFPEMTFKKPKGVSFVTYVEQGVRSGKDRAVPSARRHKLKDEGTFYIE